VVIFVPDSRNIPYAENHGFLKSCKSQLGLEFRGNVMAHEPQKIINTANSFLLAAERALEKRPLGPKQFQMLLVPAVVSYAFAVELYFKAIITLENGNDRKGHDLSKLFGGISAKSQTTLIAGVQHNCTDFKQKLGDISNVFVDWRYIFEQESAHLDFQFLKKLAQESKRVADAMANPAVNTDAAR
jgi:HEPN domain-containing protein